MYNRVISMAGKWSVWGRCRGCWPKVVGCPVNAVHTSRWPWHRLSPMATAVFASPWDKCQATTSSSLGRRPSANSMFTTRQTFEFIQSELLAASWNKLKINIISYTRIFKNFILGNSVSCKRLGRQRSRLYQTIPEFDRKCFGSTSVIGSRG